MCAFKHVKTEYVILTIDVNLLCQWSPPFRADECHNNTDLIRRKAGKMEISDKNGSLVTKTKEKNSCPGMELTLDEHEPGVAVLLLVKSHVNRNLDAESKLCCGR